MGVLTGGSGLLYGRLLKRLSSPATEPAHLEQPSGGCAPARSAPTIEPDGIVDDDVSTRTDPRRSRGRG
jgi:hypothetical protein